jgi:hypothetical protein
VLLCGVAAALLSLDYGAAQAAAAEEPWDAARSVHGKDPDARLERSVKLPASRLPLEKLTGLLSHEAGVKLECEPELLGRQVFAAGAGVRLKDLMAQLADFMECSWWVVNSPDSEPRYVLRRTDHLVQAEREIAGAAERRVLPISAGQVSDRVQRMKDYVQALDLPQAELLSRYQDSDPRLCAGLLVPAWRPFFKLVANLRPEQMAAVASGEDFVVLVRDLPADLQTHVWKCVTGSYSQWFPMFSSWSDPDSPGAPNYFSSYEQRWAHAQARLHWAPNGLQVYVDIPDLARLGHQLIWDPDDNPGTALMHLVSLGAITVRDKEAFGSTVESVTATWKERHDQEVEAERRGAFGASAVDRSDTESLARRLVPWPGDQKNEADPVQVMVQMAEQTGLCLLMDGSATARASQVPSRLRTELSLKEALDAWQAWAGSNWFWSKPNGPFLEVRDENRIFVWATQIPDLILKKMWERSRGTGALSLMDLGEVLSPLTAAQLGYGGVDRMDWPAASRRIEMDTLVALIPGGTLQRLLSGETLHYSELTSAQQQLVARLAQLRHAWIKSDELGGATIARSPETSEKGETIAIVVDYHLPGEPSGFPLAHAWPRLVPLPPRGQP